MAFHHNTRSDPNPPQHCGLIKELEKLKRERGSSATPTPSHANIVSPTTLRDIQKGISTMDSNDSNSGTRHQPDSTHPYRSPESTPLNKLLENSTHFAPRSNPLKLRSSRGNGSSRDVGTFKFPSFTQPELPNPVIDFAITFRQQLGGLKESVQQSTGFSRQEHLHIINNVDKIGQDFVDNTRALQNEFDNARNQRNHLQTQLEQAEGRELVTRADRDQARSQILKKKQSFERMRKSEGELKRKNLELLKQLEFYEDHLLGKRSLLLEQNPGSIIHRDVTGSHDPFGSPSTSVMNWKNRKGGYHGLMGPMGMIGSPAVSITGGNIASTKIPAEEIASLYSTSGGLSVGEQTPTNLKSGRRSALPVGRSTERYHTAATHESILDSLKHPEKNTEPPSPGRDQFMTNLTALVPHTSNNDATKMYADKFKAIYQMAERWCLLYASVPNPDLDSKLSEKNPSLWSYMMQCTYPRNPHDAQAHIVALLQDSKSRYLLCMRLVVNYCVKEIMIPDEFQYFDRGTSKALQGFKSSLSERGLAHNVRQSIIDQQTKVIDQIIQNTNFSTFRESRLTEHATALRNMLGPLLSRNAARSEAGRDLGALAAKSWDAAGVLHTSYMTFQTVFPDTHTKFLAATMVARDQQNKDPHSLQLAQLRLKLVITPLTTLRDDRGTTIVAKELHKAAVLTMA